MVPSSYDITVSNDKTCSTDHLLQYEYSYNNESAMNKAWENFWTNNGALLISTSWVIKYVDYINPTYLYNNMTRDEKSQDADEVATENSEYMRSKTNENCKLERSNFLDKCSSSELKSAPTSSLNTNFSYEDMTRQEADDKEADENKKKIVDLKTLSEDNNDWNPLSPFSTEESYEQQSNAEDEKLLRCDSTNNSTAKTNAISDSMTNVTKMSLTSSNCDSNSVHSSNPINSVTSSTKSNITDESLNQQKWNELWIEHLRVEYQKQYKLFVIKYKKEHDMKYDESYSNLNESGEDSIVIRQDEVTLHSLDDANNEKLSEPDSLQTDIPKMRRSKSAEFEQSYANENANTAKKTTKSNTLEKQRLIIDSVGMLLKNLRTTEQEPEIEQCPEASTQSIECKKIKYVILSVI